VRACCLLTLCPCLIAAQEPPPSRPEPVRTSITVTGSIAANAPANVTALDAGTLAATAGANLDDRLREVPGFSLFRRTSSMVAHPTTQGISLRGIGASGASRTLVLWDGVPANDPFGGWVYWTQFTPDEIGTVEISRGAATSVFGDRAMSGAIGIFTRPAAAKRVTGAYAGGNKNTHDATLGLAGQWGTVAVSGSGRAFTTDGYYIVPGANRGPVDRPASVRFATGDVHVDHYTSRGNLFLKADVLVEDRRNGTVLTHNSTSLGTVSLRYERDWGRDLLSVMGFHTREGFHSSFSSVNARRTAEQLTYLQTVPSDATGGAAMWRHAGTRWNAIAGADANRAAGESTDHLVPSGLRQGGGSQLQHGVFAQTDYGFGPVRLYGGLRHSFAGRGNRFLSPSAGLTAGRKRLRVRGSVYRAFRAPTLNELFREFRVGNTVTQANPGLRPETVFGGEAGADWIAENFSARVTAFRNSLDGLITNVTLSSAPNQIVRRRANAADVIGRGIEAELRRRWRDFSGGLEYLYADSRYATGLRVPQVPKHQGSARVQYLRGGTLASIAVRSYAYQFDDDLNNFRLGGYATLELMLRRRLAKSLSAEAAVDNALDRTYYAAFTPTPNIGAPRLWRVGLRWGR
jgi:outer membrane cobalamin receptor